MTATKFERSIDILSRRLKEFQYCGENVSNELAEMAELEEAIALLSAPPPPKFKYCSNCGGKIPDDSFCYCVPVETENRDEIAVEWLKELIEKKGFLVSWSALERGAFEWIIRRLSCGPLHPPPTVSVVSRDKIGEILGLSNDLEPEQFARRWKIRDDLLAYLREAGIPVEEEPK